MLTRIIIALVMTVSLLFIDITGNQRSSFCDRSRENSAVWDILEGVALGTAERRTFSASGTSEESPSRGDPSWPGACSSRRRLHIWKTALPIRLARTFPESAPS